MTSTELITLEQVEDVLLHGGEAEFITSEDQRADIVRRILASETLEEAFKEVESVPMKQLDGTLITIHGVKWAKSGYQEGPGVYALLDVTQDGDKHHFVSSMGGSSVMTALLWACRHDGFPIKGVPRLKPSRSNPDKSYWTFKLA